MSKKLKPIDSHKDILEDWQQGFEFLQSQNAMMSQLLQKNAQEQMGPQLLSPAAFGDALMRTAQGLLSHPEKLLEAQQNLFTQVYDLWEKTYEKSQNQDKEVTSTPDKRFRGGDLGEKSLLSFCQGILPFKF